MRKNIFIFISGCMLILYAVLSVVLFIELTIQFNYPQVLKEPTYKIIFSLAESSPSSRILWLAYSLVPLLMIPPAFAFYKLLKEQFNNISRVAVLFAVLGSFCMVIGLLRWPSLNYYLASFYPNVDSTYKNLIEITFNSFNIYAGKFIGEILAETFINLWFMLIGISFLRGEIKNTVFGVISIIAAILGLIGIYNTATVHLPTFAPVSSFLIPAWSIVMGIILIRYGVVRNKTVQN